MLHTPALSRLLCLAIIASMVFVAASVAAEDDDSDEDREVSVVPEDDGFHLVSYSVGYDVNDRFEVDFNEGSIELWYEEYADSADSPAWQLEVSMEELVSFQDNGNGYLDPGDTVVSSVGLDDDVYVSAQPIQETLADGAVRTTLTCTYGDGLLTLVFVATNSPTVTDGTEILPTEVKLSFTISGYDDEEDGGDHIALVMSVDTDAESTIGSEDGPELNITNGDLGGYLKWSETALVDGVSSPVGSQWDGDTLTLSYPSGGNIVHDPVIGVVSVAFATGPADVIASGDPMLFAVGVVVASAAIAGAVLFAMRKRR